MEAKMSCYTTLDLPDGKALAETASELIGEDTEVSWGPAGAGREVKFIGPAKALCAVVTRYVALTIDGTDADIIDELIEHLDGIEISG
jgi:hypothetical protein